MNGELAGRYLELADGLFDKLRGQFSAFAVRDHPTSNVTAEDVEDLSMPPTLVDAAKPGDDDRDAVIV